MSTFFFSLRAAAKTETRDEEKQRIRERRVVQEREREASRPFYQFVYQVSEECERIQEESADGGDTNTADINTRAYEIVKSTWTKRRIWKTRWGILPGMSWKHEEPLEEEVADGPIAVSRNALRNAQPPINHEAANRNFAPLFGPLSPVESNHREASAAMAIPQQELPADIDSAGSDNGNAEHPPSAPNLPRPRMGNTFVILQRDRYCGQAEKSNLRKMNCRSQRQAQLGAQSIQQSYTQRSLLCLLVFHKAFCLVFAVEKFTEYQLLQSGTPFLLSLIRADGQLQPVADIATNGRLRPFVGEIWWLAWAFKYLWGKEVGHITGGSSK
jgi:hypothetical protein